MIKLDYFKESDFATLVEWNENTSPEFLMQWAGPEFTYPLTEEQLVNYIKGVNHPGANRYLYQAVDEDSGQVIGHLAIVNIDYEQNSARIAKVIVGNPEARGKGYGKQMISLALKICFEELQMHRVTLGVFDFNQGALNCYQQVGFKIEGLLRDCRKMGDSYWSLYEMSMLENEWKSNIRLNEHKES
ncbi:RimJ/RimL family protein N-acetyltransferase [Natronobacillus azotifigens]|uniref:GNAT family protein n=1 Tax=Natronobacillus azotifigens TaxID=472978 RepID=A0A9J6RFK5_9BACI|nr:GNAT family protein [Natronobacillus azotifigens]MCZ0704343.1 GNAT family protein [Natronobacillus azotifigens]